MRLQSISLLFHCYWKRQRGLFLGIRDDRNLGYLLFPMSASPSSFQVIPSTVVTWTGATQCRSISHSSSPKYLWKSVGEIILLQGWDMTAGRHIPVPSLRCFFLPPASSFTSLPPPLSYPSNFVLLCFFILLPFLLVFTAIPQSTPLWQHETTTVFFPARGKQEPISCLRQNPSPLLSPWF